MEEIPWHVRVSTLSTLATDRRRVLSRAATVVLYCARRERGVRRSHYFPRCVAGRRAPCGIGCPNRRPRAREGPRAPKRRSDARASARRGDGGDDDDVGVGRWENILGSHSHRCIARAVRGARRVGRGNAFRVVDF